MEAGQITQGKSLLAACRPKKGGKSVNVAEECGTLARVMDSLSLRVTLQVSRRILLVAARSRFRVGGLEFTLAACLVGLCLRGAGIAPVTVPPKPSTVGYFCPGGGVSGASCTGRPTVLNAAGIAAILSFQT